MYAHKFLSYLSLQIDICTIKYQIHLVLVDATFSISDKGSSYYLGGFITLLKLMYNALPHSPS